MKEYFDQHESSIRFEWGVKGVEVLAPVSECIILVDILSFSTCVEIVLSNGATVLPYPWKDESAFDYGRRHGALVANPKRTLEESEGYSLSPTSLLTLPEGKKIVLPSPNGSTLAFLAKEKSAKVFIAGFRNAQATARYCEQFPSITVVACGERWEDDESLRPCLEDFLGAGAIISFLRGKKSPEAQTAEKAYLEERSILQKVIENCGSGLELIDRGFLADVKLAAEENVSKTVCFLDGNEVRVV